MSVDSLSVEPFIIGQWQFNDVHPIPVETSEDVSQPIEVNHWYHCQREMPNLRTWLQNNGVEEGIIKSLLADDTRPRFEAFDDGDFMLILRGVNLNEGALPDDTLSLRILWHKGTLISTRKIPSKAIYQIQEALKQGKGARSLAQLLSAIIDGMNRHIEEFLDTIEDNLFELEESVRHTDELPLIHKRLLNLKRFLKPQRYALNDLVSQLPEPLEMMDAHFRNGRDIITRITESIDFYLEQVQLIQAEYMHAQSERMNRNTYLFTIIAALFLPVSFLTGLLGINIGGMPGVDNPMAFGLFVIGLLVCFGLEVILLKWLKVF